MEVPMELRFSKHLGRMYVTMDRAMRYTYLIQSNLYCTIAVVGYNGVISELDTCCSC
jgi:hypothetical protein